MFKFGTLDDLIKRCMNCGAITPEIGGGSRTRKDFCDSDCEKAWLVKQHAKREARSESLGDDSAERTQEPKP